MVTLERFYPGWRNLVIHESSPIARGASRLLAQECPDYIPSQYYPDYAPGEIVENVRCENLESLSFADESVDLHITQDVMEHLLHPALAIKEIARTLKPGGAHIFTTPLVNKSNPSQPCIRIDDDGKIIHLTTPEYHGNPVSGEGSLVTVYWGYDICHYIHRACGLFTHLVHIEDLSKGIKAELNEVLVTVKPQRS
jgi:SAM-dependent methyltransferase